MTEAFFHLALSCSQRTSLKGMPLLGMAASFLIGQAAAAADPVRVGIVGIDNYQCLAFTQLWHKPPADNPDLLGLQVVAAWKGGSPDYEETLVDAERWVERLEKLGVRLEDSVEAVLARVDAVMIMTIDGRAHRALAEQVLKAGKPLYIGRPMAASLEDVIAIFELAKQYETPVFSCSQHRFSPGFIGMRDHEEVGQVTGCAVYGGSPVVEHHPEFFGHAVHSFETLYTIMGPGAVTVTRARTDDTELVTGVWKDGRIGTYRGIRRGAVKYSALVFGEKGIAPAGVYGYAAPVRGVTPKDRYKGYEGVATEIARFYKTGKLPVSPEETIELWGFMEAAHESRRQGGVPARIDEAIAKARKKLETETAR